MEQKTFGFYMRKISDGITGMGNRMLKELDLTYTQMEVLCYLLHHKTEHVTQKMVEQHFQLAHPTVVGLLQRLEKKEFLYLQVDETDRRFRQIVLLEKAVQLEQCMDRHRQIMNERLAGLMTEAEQTQLLNLLERVYQEIVEHPDPNPMGGMPPAHTKD